MSRREPYAHAAVDPGCGRGADDGARLGIQRDAVTAREHPVRAQRGQTLLAMAETSCRARETFRKGPLQPVGRPPRRKGVGAPSEPRSGSAVDPSRTLAKSVLTARDLRDGAQPA